MELRISSGGNPEDVAQALIQRVRDFKPTHIFMQRPENTRLKQRHLSAMRAVLDFKLMYHEADPYLGPLHPLPFASRAVAKFSDVVFTIGSGAFIRNFTRLGVKDVRYVPWCFEPDRVGAFEEVAISKKSHDVVVIAHRNNPRWRGLPNWRERIRFVELLQERFGDRLAIYGRNWTGVGAKGLADFHTQSETIKTGWITANWDHFASEPKYFSNRLPISLASGSVHATTRHPGYDELFPEDTRDFLLLGTSPEHLVAGISEKLQKSSKDELLSVASEARSFAEKYFRQDRKIVEMLNFSGLEVSPTKAEECWNVNAESLMEI
jgi:hypothetical protein